MKKILGLGLLITLSIVAKAQWEFQYFVLKVGANHHFMSAQPDSFPNLYLQYPEGERQLKSAAGYFDYVPGAQIGLTFHYDFDNDNGGFVIGTEYSYRGFSSKYETIGQKYSMIEKYYVQSFSIPVMIKFGREIFNKQKYFFVGAQYALNLALHSSQKASWETEVRSFKGTAEQLRKSNILFLAGFNYMVFNVQISYQSQSFLNSEYEVNIEQFKNRPIYVKPFAVQPGKLIYIQTSFNVPLSPWTTKKNYQLHRFLRKFRR